MVIFYHDNTRPHVDVIHRWTLYKLDWYLMKHPSYSPDMAIQEFNLFSHLHLHLVNLPSNWGFHNWSLSLSIVHTVVLRTNWKVKKNFADNYVFVQRLQSSLSFVFWDYNRHYCTKITILIIFSYHSHAYIILQ